MKVYTCEQYGTDGLTYGLRMLLEPSELRGLQAAGILPDDVSEVIGTQHAADTIVAAFEKETYAARGGTLQ